MCIMMIISHKFQESLVANILSMLNYSFTHKIVLGTTNGPMLARSVHLGYFVCWWNI
jgi:hypothetical protein